jgi:hypothetical protein
LAESKSNSYNIINRLIARSLFTDKQISIISNIVNSRPKPEKMSSGAYYRQVRQCRDKVQSLLYSIILLQSIGVIDKQSVQILERISSQVGVMLSTNNSDVQPDYQIESVISVIDTMVKKMYKM